MVNVISLMTDFGSKDQYVGVMKSVILARNPAASIVDITHEIDPQNVNQAKFLTKCSYSYFPNKSVHIIVVDPDVGTNREIIILETPEAFFIAPDNGVLSEVVRSYVDIGYDYSESFVNPDGLCKLYALDKEQYWNQPVSNTFHGRDIFAPVGALLANGQKPKQFGRLIKTMIYDPLPLPIMGKNLIEEYRDVYNKRLNTWCKNKGYTDPFLHGYAKERVKVGGETYTLCKKVHSEVCDDPYCRALYLTTDEYTQKNRYSKYPIYTSDTRNINLCGVCIDRM